MTEWMNRAACREVGHEAFFPEFTNPMENHFAFREAIKVCEGCEVRRECYEYVLDNPTIRDGIWGGKYAVQIAKERKRRR